MAAFPSEVEEIHGLVCIDSIPAVDQPGGLFGDIQQISKHWPTLSELRLIGVGESDQALLY